MRHALLLAAALLLLPCAASAQRTFGQAPSKCDSPVQFDLNECAADAFRAADARLNATYRRITARLAGNPAGRSLVEAQRAWIRLRDAECDLATSASEGGSIRPMLTSSCMEHLTQQRTAELEEYMRCGSGDECVAPAR